MKLISFLIGLLLGIVADGRSVDGLVARDANRSKIEDVGWMMSRLVYRQTSAGNFGRFSQKSNGHKHHPTRYARRKSLDLIPFCKLATSILRFTIQPKTPLLLQEFVVVG